MTTQKEARQQGPGNQGIALGKQNHSTTLQTYSNDIKRLHIEAQQYAANAIKRASEAGQLLIEAKSQVSHGNWLPFLESTGMGIRTAQRYMRLAENSDRLKSDTVSHLTINQALEYLAEPKDEEPEPEEKEPEETPAASEELQRIKDEDREDLLLALFIGRGLAKMRHDSKDCQDFDKLYAEWFDGMCIKTRDAHLFLYENRDIFGDGDQLLYEYDNRPDRELTIDERIVKNRYEGSALYLYKCIQLKEDKDNLSDAEWSAMLKEKRIKKNYARVEVSIGEMFQKWRKKHPDLKEDEEKLIGQFVDGHVLLELDRLYGRIDAETADYFHLYIFDMQEILRKTPVSKRKVMQNKLEYGLKVQIMAKEASHD